MGVAAEDLPVQTERDHALLDPGAAALVQPDQRAAGLQGEVDDLDDLLPVHLAEAAAEDGHVLAEDADRSLVDGAEPGDHAVAVGPFLLHPERGGPVPGELVQLGERAGIEQQFEAFPGGLLAPGVLLLDRRRRAGVHGLVDPQPQVGELAGRGVPVRACCVAVHESDSSG